MEFLGKCLLIEDKGEKNLVIGDLHLGYEEALNRGGVYLGRKMFEEYISYLNLVFGKLGKIDRVILLGDVKHVFSQNLRQEWNDVLELFDYFFNKKIKEIKVIRGNHDNYIKTIAGKREIEVLDFLILGDMAFMHGDRDFEEINTDKIKCWILGHGHPAVKLREGVKTEKYKCYLIGKYKDKKIIVVPSFFEYNEGSDPRENDFGMPWNFNFDKFEVKIIGESLKVMDFGKLSEIN